MITIIYSTHKDKEYNEKFKTHLINSVGLNDVQILEYQNNNQYSLAQVYNSGITESKYDIVVCCHNDIKLEKDWGKKLLEDYSNYPEFGIIGKAGSCYFPKSGVYWEKMTQTMVGQVWHHPKGQNKWLNTYSPKLPFIIPVVTIDGLFMSFNKNKIKHLFDESFGKFHFYDHGFCIPNYLDDVKIGVTSSFEITHESVGQPNQEFFESKIKFIEKYGDKLPLDLKPGKIYTPEVKIKDIKISGKVAIIIPTKHNLDLLIQCVDSFFEFCNPKLFDIIIADTGSTDDELSLIQELVDRVDNVKLVKYDYYNFSKINNDIVKNHLNKNHKYLLFCNNDIKLTSDVISGMLNVFETKPRVGTVGCRLHYEDNTVQHNGIIVYMKISTKELFANNSNKNNYFNYKKDIFNCIGNTAGLMMINKNTFTQIGMFNENYIECFEDVELNLKLLTKGFINYNVGTHTAYHYESKTRDIDNNHESIKFDFNKNLIPFIEKNLTTLKDKILFMQ
jgi:GT2 family glycosyltransferase